MRKLAPAILVALSLFAANGVFSQSGTKANGHADFALLKTVRGYQTWAPANEEPMMMSRQIDLLCRAPTPAELKEAQSDPHYHKFIRVFTNAKGAKAMAEGGDFPVGSIIVKEKRIGRNGDIELLTVMRKREKGYNPGCGDWEFATVDGKLTRLTSQGKVEKCMSCHSKQAARDFTFRTYVEKR